jgi:phosphatidylglycerophosphatase A
MALVDRLILFVAQGFGSGRIPWAPGTFGSVVGLAWVVALGSIGTWPVVGVAVVASAILAVWFCGRAEAILRQRDPGSVVLDEIVALPLCFVGPALMLHWSRWPDWPHWRKDWLLLLAGFLLFRIFDVWKPWPVRQSQSLARGWGVVVDDLLAAVYVSVVLALGVWVNGGRAPG